jgi:hypothetical protein
MVTCPKCRKEVVAIAVSMGAVPDDELGKMRARLESEGKLVVFNPPPVGRLRCPRCGSETVEARRP